MNLWFDVRYAWRLLKKSWGYSLMCASVVALSVGLALWTWSMAYSQLLKPVGLPDSKEWYSVQISAEAGATPRPASVDAYTYQELRKHTRAVEHLGAFENRVAVLSEGQASTSLRSGAMSPRLLSQVVPLMGRTFQESDARPGATPVAIISYDTWQNYFAGDPNVVGKTTRIDAAPVQVIGVMHKEFFALQDFQLWVPLQLPNLARPTDPKPSLNPIVVLADNQTLEAAIGDVNRVIERVSGDYPDLYNRARRGALIATNRMYTHPSTPIVVMLIFISAAVLVLGAVNISLVFLARLLERSREIALRTALGASRGRILRQCLLETALIIVVGLVIGCALAAMGVRWTDAWGNHLNKVLAIGRLPATMVLRPIDLFAAVAAAVGIWLLSTLLPARRIAKRDAAEVLAGSGKGVALRGSNRSAGLLVGFQVVIASLVLVLCGSMVLAVDEEVSKPTGLSSAGVMISTNPTVFDQARYAEPARRMQYWQELSGVIRSRIPGAEVAFATAAPTRPGRGSAVIDTQGDSRSTVTVPVASVMENYFDMLGVRVRSGRLFDSTDDSASLDVAVVDEVLAERYWPGQDVVGKRIQLTAADETTWVTVVGVVSAVAGGRPYRKEDVGVIYQPLRQTMPSAFHVLVKLPGNAADARSQLRAAAFAVDRDLPLHNLQTLDDYIAALRFSNKSLITIIITVALITAMITAAGLFGLISRSVAQRTHEVGIRRALGATPWRATAMFRRQGAIYLIVAAVGVTLAVMMMPPLSKAVTNILKYAMPVTVGVVLLMAGVIFTASYLPSRRAVALEPGDALRYE